ncbi:hypothetical protein [Erythrobacter oryzae]|uniref:hypothetical protein n=1 Tax=Erythrobacter oryzae TaxID=3019556 RepID=UPI002553F397|nr:hypothetical protein [Erythrobacter sp. COR-2]
MATAAAPRTERSGDTRFFMVMALVMCAATVSGFALNLALGRSSFAEPVTVHAHGMVFMAWLGLYAAQAISIASGNVALHRQLGKAAYGFIPVMMVAGTAVMVHSAQSRGGPFFFGMNEFVISNTMLLYTFGILTFWALRVRRHQGWHRRLMLVAMSILTGPGLGRILPAPLMIPYAWQISIAVTWLFPLIGMFADWRRDGRVHPAYARGFGLYIAVFAASMLIAHSALGIAITEWLVAGTPGAERPMAPFLPPGFGG